MSIFNVITLASMVFSPVRVLLLFYEHTELHYTHFRPRLLDSQLSLAHICVYDVAGPVIEYSDSLKDTQKIKAGKSLVLSVNIVGAPTPKASWWRNDVEVKSGLDVTVEGDGTFSRLTVKNTSGDVTGKYKVVAENNVGSDSAEFDVVILGQFNSRHHLTVVLARSQHA